MIREELIDLVVLKTMMDDPVWRHPSFYPERPFWPHPRNYPSFVEKVRENFRLLAAGDHKS